MEWQEVEESFCYVEAILVTGDGWTRNLASEA